MTGDEYRSFVVPAALPLFTVRDRAVRMQLLERIEGLVKHMDAGTINGPVFEALLAGFADTAKILRELTLKSMLALAPKLNEKNLTERLCRALAKLQVRKGHTETSCIWALDPPTGGACPRRS